MSEEVYQKNMNVAKINALFMPITKIGQGFVMLLHLVTVQFLFQMVNYR